MIYIYIFSQRLSLLFIYLFIYFFCVFSSGVVLYFFLRRVRFLILNFLSHSFLPPPPLSLSFSFFLYFFFFFFVRLEWGGG